MAATFALGVPLGRAAAPNRNQPSTMALPAGAAPAPAGAVPSSAPTAAPSADGATAPAAMGTVVEHSRAFSLALGFPSGGSAWLGGSFGGWYMVSQKVNLGLNLGILVDPHRSLDDDGVSATQTRWALDIQPAVKVYVVQQDVVAPYFWGGLLLGLGGDNHETNPVNLSLAGGLGAEVFLMHYQSFSGQVGLQLELMRGDIPRPPPRLSSLTSALAVNIYF